MHVKIIKLDADAKPVEIGRVVLLNGKASIPEKLKWVKEVVDVSPDKGKAFLEALPNKLYGTYLWATNVMT